MSSETETKSVWVTSNCNSRVASKCYHTDPECAKVGESMTEISLSELPNRMRVCRVCSGTVNRTSYDDCRPSLRSMIDSGEVEI